MKKSYILLCTEEETRFDPETDEMEWCEIVVALRENTILIPYEKRIVRVLREDNKLIEWNEVFDTRFGWGHYDSILKEFITTEELYNVYVK